MSARIAERKKYRTRIKEIVSSPPTTPDDIGSELATQAHWAKYSCVLISGYIEQSIKEILLEHAQKTSAPRIRKYIEETWPTSRNMKAEAIKEILDQFDSGWAEEFNGWLTLDERKKEINEIIKWRNDIAHGKESNTNNVTLASVKTKLGVACDLIDFLENLPNH